MTDERLDQILKQALTPAINDSEIQIRRKVRNRKMNVKRTVAIGLAACAVLSLTVTGGFFKDTSKTGDKGTVAVSKEQETASNELTTVSNNIFAITAYAAELPEDISSGDVIDIRLQSGDGSFRYLDGRFTISGENIERVKVTTDQCEIYTVVPVYSMDPDYEKLLQDFNDGMTLFPEYEPVLAEDNADLRDIDSWKVDYFNHFKVEGQSYEGAYNDQLSFGMSVPEALWSTNEDPKESYHETVDRVEGATITITVTFADGSVQEHKYRLNVGKIYVPVDEQGRNQWDNLTRFLTEEESKTGTGYSYGYLLEKMD